MKGALMFLVLYVDRLPSWLWSVSAFQTPLGKSSRRIPVSRFVFERMSEDCIAAVVTAQEQTNKLQLPQVDTECMIAGCIDHPEIPALKRTLKQYGITWRLVEPTLTKMYRENSDGDGSGWLSGFRAAKNEEDRPFGKDLKRTFVNAGKIADQMGSESVGTHHVFLALLEYEEKDSEPKAAEVDEDTATCSCGAWAVLSKMDCFDDDVKAVDVCNSLLKNMESSSDERELVTGVGGSDKMPTLLDCGTDLTQQAEDGLLDPVFGRDAETRSVIRTLIRRRKNNACLIGEPGTGKTAIAEGVAQVLVSDKCPARLQGHRLFTLELSNLVAGTKYRGEFEERLQAIIKEVMDPKAPPTILFIDEIHTIVNAGAADGGLDASNILKPSLARGDLQLIGATTISEYRKYIEKDAALERRFQPIMVKEPSLEKTVSILEAVRSNYERHHGVKYSNEALATAAALSDRYITDRFLPDKALDLLDEAGAVAHLDALSEDDTPLVDEHLIAEVISEWSGVPIGKLETTEMQRLRSLEEDMTSRVKGQERAVRSVARAVRRARSGLRDSKRPVASFLFCGGTGTGKTLLCKTLAETYYGSEKDMIRIDMSEYMDKFSVSRLTGPPPGYVGYDDGGQLTEAVRRAPHSLILLDELEKAHPDVLSILLQVLEDGILTDGKGRTVNFKNTVLVMTSNVGSKRILDISRAVGKEGGPQPEPKTPANELTPDNLLQQMQSNPEVAAIIQEASSNEKIMNVIQSAAGSSPTDVLRSSQQDPEVARLLERLWSALDTNESTLNEKKSGLDAVRSSLRESLSGWDQAEKEKFSTGLINQVLKDEGPSMETEMAVAVKEELEKEMKPELLNRIDEIVVFSPLSTDDLSQISEITVSEITERARKEQNLELTVDNSILSTISDEGGAQVAQFGARPIRRAAQRLVEDSVSDAIVRGFLEEGDTVTISLQVVAGMGQNNVIVTRQRDGESIIVEVDEVGSGIGSVAYVPSDTFQADVQSGDISR